MRALGLVVSLACACAAPPDKVKNRPAVDSLVLRNARITNSDQLVSIRIESGRIAAIGPELRGDNERDVEGKFVVPQIIDSHVHLAYFPVADDLRARGVAATVDLGAPTGTLASAGPRSLASGPMLTPTRGYPTQSWGADGYGLEIATAADGIKAVDELAAAGATVIKVPLPDARGLGGKLLEAVVTRAHELELRVVGHALSANDVLVAADAGVDVLAHAPLEPLTRETATAWAPRPVISTLSAFDSQLAGANLARLRAAGSPVLYGTDLGNTREVGISKAEIEAMIAAAMTGEEILASMTETPSAFWRLDVGRLAEGASACLAIVDADPRESPATLASPSWVSDC